MTRPKHAANASLRIRNGGFVDIIEDLLAQAAESRLRGDKMTACELEHDALSRGCTVEQFKQYTILVISLFFEANDQEGARAVFNHPVVKDYFATPAGHFELCSSIAKILSDAGRIQEAILVHQRAQQLIDSHTIDPLTVDYGALTRYARSLGRR